jgi:hypothetical protein
VETSAGRNIIEIVTRRPRRWLRALPALALLLAIAFAMRHTVLRGAGRLLVVDEPIERADAVVVPTWASDAGAIEAADLVHNGVTPLVAVLGVRPTAAEEELKRRHVRHQNETEDLIELLRSLGVAKIDVIPSAAGGTQDEGMALASWCRERRLQSVVVVSAPDHARRARRVLRRSMGDAPTRMTIRAARYAAFDPDRWWTTHDGLRIGIVELEKLLLDVIRHPLS